jgi:transposase
LNSKIHLAVDAHGMPVKCIVTSGTTTDYTQAASLIDGLEAAYLLADRVWAAVSGSQIKAPGFAGGYLLPAPGYPRKLVE